MGVRSTTLPSVRRGVTAVLGWLSTHPGLNWQEKWLASGAEEHLGDDSWKALAEPWLQARGWDKDYGFKDLGTGLRRLICADVFRPSMRWMLSHPFTSLVAAMGEIRDPEGFARLRDQIAGMTPVPRRFSSGVALKRISTILAAKGGMVADITVGDCIEILDTQDTTHSRGGQGKTLFYQLLVGYGCFPPDAPLSARAFRAAQGQMTCEQLIDRYGLQCRPVRNLLVEYLKERQAALDYTTLKSLSYTIGLLFWRNLEEHHPGIDSLDLPPDVVTAWKQRIMFKSRAVRGTDGTLSEVKEPRTNVNHCLTLVRAFYLDIAQWAAEEPARWAAHVAPCPIRAHEVSQRKQIERARARMHQRTRHRLPLLPAVIAIAERRRATAAQLLAVAKETEPGTTLTFEGITYLRPTTVRRDANTIRVTDTATGEVRNLTYEEHATFWAWAAIEVLRHTGIRIEELHELNHHSFVQYRLPTTGELVPLLQVAPSKTDTERLLLISPELADVLSTIVSRVRGADGAIPLISAYDTHERVWNPPLPLLFQYKLGTEDRPVTGTVLRRFINDILQGEGLVDPDGQPLRLTPHDFRRMFVTDMIMNGLPPHIAQIICGHRDINTTMGYKAIYPQEAIEQHRAFIARRRSMRPSEEYRTPTDEEWEEFLGHFELRKVSLGTCGRAYGTPCIHEHACVRCSMLRPDPAQRPRLAEIRDNLIARIEEAEREGWRGEIAGLKVSLAGAEAKLAQLDGRSAVHLGMPDLSRVVGRTVTGPEPSAHDD
ncbi:tyrosine-type recombinase/integrase [Streptomyces sp. NPDC001393]